MFKFSPLKVFLGLVATGLGLDQILKNFNIELIPYVIPPIVYYVILVIVGLILIYKGFIPIKAF